MLVAEDEAGTIVGTVTLVLNQPENQPHRGEIAKLLVHRRVRRHGLGAALLATAERQARRASKTLLVLDTVTGSDGERLYTAHGWRCCGEIPDYALWPDGRLCSTTIFYKALGADERNDHEAYRLEKQDDEGSTDPCVIGHESEHPWQRE